MDVKLFTNNQSESEKMSLAGESSGGRWGSGWGRAGMGGVMSASGMCRRGSEGGTAETCGADFLLCGQREEQQRRGGERRGEPGGPRRLMRWVGSAGGKKNIMKKLKQTQVAASEVK